MEGRYKLLQPLGDTILWGDGRLCDVVVPELGRVGCYERFGEFGDHQLTAIVFEGDNNTPSFFAAEIP